MISILIPLFNGIEFLEKSLASIDYQTYKNWELIIGINGYPPNSEIEIKAKEIVKNIQKDIRVIYYDTKGKADTLNKMIKDCKYEHIALLDVDDFWNDDKLEKQVKYIQDYDVVGTGCLCFGENNFEVNIPKGDLSNYNFLESNPIINSSTVIKKECCYWTDEFFGLDDYELWLRLWKQGKKFYNVHEVLCHHRIHKESAFNSKGNHLSVHKLILKYT